MTDLNIGPSHLSLKYSVMLPFFTYNYFGPRAHKRLDGECVFGQRITVGPPHHAFPDHSPQFGYYVSQSPVYSSNSGWPQNTNGRPLIYPTGNYSGYAASLGQQSNYGGPMESNGTEQYRRNMAKLFAMQNSPTIQSPANNSTVGFEVRNRSPIPSPYGSAFSWHQNASQTNNQSGFLPISSGSNASSNAASPENLIDLNITNLDQKIPNTNLKRILLNLFSQHVTVTSISLYTLGDNNTAAIVSVPTQQDAQMAIAKLQRAKVGQRRISIAYANAASNNAKDTTALRKQVVALLQEVPDGRVPLFRFLEMFKARYTTSVSISELHQLKDLVTISLDSSGRTLSLNIKHRRSPTFHQEVAVYCVKHFREGQASGWADKELPPLPQVLVPLKEFINNVVSLIESHGNALPLASIYDCYTAQCGQLKTGPGVPLEHLVTCCPSKFELAQNSAGVRYLRFVQRPGSSLSTTSGRSPTPSLPPTLMSMLNMFSVEIVNLLKSHKGSQLEFHKLIPAYHHYFKKQCRVSSYGFIRLIELLEAVPSVVQVIGEGDRRIVTLTHNAQVQRFRSEVCRILKAEPARSVALSALPDLYHQFLGHSLDPVDYGVCYLSDLIEEISSSDRGIIVSTLRSGETILSLPRSATSSNRSSSAVSSSGSAGTPSPPQADINDFISEVIELLGLDPHLSIEFSKFIPAYHHHFGYQCRVADFGYSKLIELFEAIPHIVEIDESDKEKRVTLTLNERVKVVADQIASLVWFRYPPGLPLSALNTSYLWRYGTNLKPAMYGAESIAHLVDILPTVELTDDDNTWVGRAVVPVENEIRRRLGNAVVRRLVSSLNGKMSLGHLSQYFAPKLRQLLSSPEAVACLAPNAVMVDAQLFLVLTPVYQQIKKLYELVDGMGEGKACLSTLEKEAVDVGVELCGHPTLAALVSSAGRPVLALCGKEPRLAVHIIPDDSPDVFTFPQDPKGNMTCDGEESEEDSSTLVTPIKWQPTDNFQVSSLELPIPAMTTPPAAAIEESMSLMSPYKGLLSAHVSHPSLAAPHPSLLPRPDLPPVDQPLALRRKLKLAAQFASPLSKN